jgi:hypothetical protein
MFDPNQQYPVPQMGGFGAASPIMAAMLQKYMMNQQNQQQQSLPSTPAQTMGMIQGNSQNWGSSMPQQGLMQPQQGPGSPMPSPQVTNGG